VLVAAHLIEIVLLLGAPLVLARILQKRWRLPLGIFGAGLLAFVFAELGKILLSRGLGAAFEDGAIPMPDAEAAEAVSAALAGAVAALVEEPLRWGAMSRYVESRSQRAGVLAGVGFGGGHAMLRGALVLVMATLAVVLHDMTFDEMQELGVEGGAAVKIGLKVFAWWEGDPAMALLAAWHGLAILLFHVGLGALAMQGLRRGALRYLGMCVLLHFAFAALLSYVETASLSTTSDALVHVGAALVALVVLTGTARARDARSTQGAERSDATLDS